MPDDPASRFERLYADSVTALLGFCLRRCESREDAADLVSEVFLVAWRRIEEIPEGDEARLWLFGVAHRLLANQERASRRQRNLGARLERYLDEVDAPDPAAVLDRHEAGRPVREALATLAPQDGALLTLVAWEGLSPTEAGRVVGLSAGTARVRLFRARGRLRAALAASDADPDLVPTSRTQSVPTGIKEA
ncbi:MAG TPA: RNA polymerase sigma factor [Actinospica sp.]|nr:RNA polymerase sigma factor [Actinospica sp.]